MYSFDQSEEIPGKVLKNSLKGRRDQVVILMADFLTGKYQRTGKGPQDARASKETRNFIQFDEDKAYAILLDRANSQMRK